jgi:hypothetical protein
MLLNIVQWPKGFDESKTFGREEPWETFNEACVARGVLAVDNEGHLYVTQAVGFPTAPQYRQLYYSIICNHHEANALQLFETHFVPLSDDAVPLSEDARRILGADPSGSRSDRARYNGLLPAGDRKGNPTNRRWAWIGRLLITSTVRRRARSTTTRRRDTSRRE